jgi:hypothetical protein
MSTVGVLVTAGASASAASRAAAPTTATSSRTGSYFGRFRERPCGRHDLHDQPAAWATASAASSARSPSDAQSSRGQHFRRRCRVDVPVLARGHLDDRGGSPGWYTSLVPTRHPRIQVTVDRELAEALDAVDPRPHSRSRLIRDLAVRGAAAERAEREQRQSSREFLLRIARGETDYDPAGAAEIHAEREAEAE